MLLLCKSMNPYCLLSDSPYVKTLRVHLFPVYLQGTREPTEQHIMNTDFLIKDKICSIPNSIYAEYAPNLLHHYWNRPGS